MHRWNVAVLLLVFLRATWAADLGAPCKTRQECLEHFVGSDCIDEICACPETHLPSVEKGACILRSKRRLDECESNIQCPGLLQCINRKCECGLHYHFDSQNSRCLYNKGIGDECDLSSFGCYLPDQGKKQHIECVNGVCNCQTSYKPSDDNRRCVSKLSLNDTCDVEKSLVCPEMAVCVNHKCTCIENYHPSSDKSDCLLTRGLGDDCNDANHECFLQDDGISQHIKCVNGKCQCETNYIESRNKTTCKYNGSTSLAVQPSIKIFFAIFVVSNSIFK